VISALFGAIMAWAAHSSVAVALLVVSLTGKGILPLSAAIALMIGANVGTAINPLLEGSRGANVEGRRAAVGNLATRIIGAVVVMPMVPWIGRMLVQVEPDLARAVAGFHAGFNIVIALAFLPLLTPVARVLERILPNRLEITDPLRPLYLGESAIESPSIALGYAVQEALRMVDVLDSMIEGAAAAFRRRRDRTKYRALGGKADEAWRRTLGRGGTRDRSDLPGRAEQPWRSRSNLHDGWALIEQKKEFVAGRPTRSALISPVAEEQWEAGAASRPDARHQAPE
jgi:Na+/phosphate symporter